MNGYVVIENKGEVDVNAFRLMGASTKEGDNTKIGYYGSGIKYAITSALREGIPLRVFSGKKEIKISLKKATMAGQEFDVVCINNAQTSLTTRMGKDWKVWFIFREFYCNAIDEGGMTVRLSDTPEGVEGQTRVYIGMVPKMTAVMDRFDRYFSERRTAKFEEGKVKVYPRIADKMSVYRKGILVFSQHESIYDYDFPQLEINESRECSDFEAQYNIVEFWKQSATREMIGALINHPESYEFARASWTLGSSSIMGANWLEALKDKTIVPKEYAGHFADDMSNYVVVLPHTLCQCLHQTFGDKLLIRGFADKEKDKIVFEPTQKQDTYIKKATSFLERAGIDLKDIPIIISDLGAGTWGQAEDGKIYLSHAVFDKGSRQVVETILEEWAHIRSQQGDRTRGMQDYLLSMVVSSFEEKLNEYL